MNFRRENWSCLQFASIKEEGRIEKMCLITSIISGYLHESLWIVNEAQWMRSRSWPRNKASWRHIVLSYILEIGKENSIWSAQWSDIPMNNSSMLIIKRIDWYVVAFDVATLEHLSFGVHQRIEAFISYVSTVEKVAKSNDCKGINAAAFFAVQLIRGVYSFMEEALFSCDLIRR